MKVIFSTNFRPKTKKIVRAVFEKNIKVSDFGLIWRPFREHLQIKIFFKNPAQWLFYFYSPLASCKKSKKSLELFLKKMFYQPTNQPTLIWRPFHEYLQIKNFFQNSGSVTFLPLLSPNLMQKIRKILWAISEKTSLPTNYYKQHQIL